MDGVKSVTWFGGMLIFNGIVYYTITVCTCEVIAGLFGGVVDASSAFASAEAPAEDRGKVLGRLQSSVSAGSLVGPLIGGVTASILGFSALLMSIAVITFIVCIFGALKLIETTHMPKSQTPNTNKGIRRSFQCLLCTQQTCRFIIVGVLANFCYVWHANCIITTCFISESYSDR